MAVEDRFTLCEDCGDVHCNACGGEIFADAAQDACSCPEGDIFRAAYELGRTDAETALGAQSLADGEGTLLPSYSGVQMRVTDEGGEFRLPPPPFDPTKDFWN